MENFSVKNEIAVEYNDVNLEDFDLGLNSYDMDFDGAQREALKQENAQLKMKNDILKNKLNNRAVDGGAASNEHFFGAQIDALMDQLDQVRMERDAFRNEKDAMKDAWMNVGQERDLLKQALMRKMEEMSKNLEIAEQVSRICDKCTHCAETNISVENDYQYNSNPELDEQEESSTSKVHQTVKSDPDNALEKSDLEPLDQNIEFGETYSLPSDDALGPSFKKRRGCSVGPSCAGCAVAECGVCAPCLDKPARGGANRIRQKCVLRRCRGGEAAPEGGGSQGALGLRCTICSKMFGRKDHLTRHVKLHGN
jgi:flagellar biosynthesis chaperone FliJ